MPEAKKADSPEEAKEAARKGEGPVEVKESAEEKKERRAADDTYDRERLLSESDAFLGVPPHVLAGALALEPNKKNFSLDDAKSLVEKWQKRPVEVE